MPEEDLIELKFRLFDGSDIGPIRYSSTSTVAMLKDRIISEWPRGRGLLIFSFRVSKTEASPFFRIQLTETSRLSLLSLVLQIFQLVDFW